MKLIGFWLCLVALLISAHRLPAPISEIPESTPSPKPQRETVPRSRPEQMVKPRATPALSFAGTWTGPTTYTGNGETKNLICQLKISNDERMVEIYWSKVGKQNVTDPGGQAGCSRSGETLTWKFTEPASGLPLPGWTATDTLRANVNGTVNFVRDGRRSNGAIFQQTGTLSRQ